MKTLMQRAALICALFLTSSFASAREPEEWGPYVAVDLGTTSFNASKAQLDEWSEAPAQASSLHRSDTGFSLATGFRFSQYLAVEAAYLELGRYSYRIEDEGEAAELSFGSRGPALSVIGTLPINHMWSLEARAGGYLGKLHGWVALEFGDEDLKLEGSGGSDAGLLLGAAVVASFGGNWSVRLGYDYVEKAAGFGNDDPDTTVDSSAGRVLLGIRYRF